MSRFKCFIVVFLCISVNTVCGDDAGNENLQYELTLPPMPPRIYAQAPSKVTVTRIKVSQWSGKEIVPGNRDAKQLGVDGSLNYTGSGFRYSVSFCSPWFDLFRNEWTDYELFHIDKCSGKISTARYVEKGVGHQYKLIIVAKDQMNETLSSKEIVVEVTPYNSKPPVFVSEHYTTEILDTSAPGTLALTLSATDEDRYQANRDLFFSLKDPKTMQNDPWFYPLRTPLEVNTTTGEIRVRDSLVQYNSPLHFLVLVSDGGSPQRVDTSKLTLHIRNMSAPRNVRILNRTESSIKVCWSPPLHGAPEGYLVKYTARGLAASSRGRRAGGTLNKTIDELETKTDDPPIYFDMMSEGVPLDVANFTEQRQTPLDDVHEELYNFFKVQFCADVEGLAPLTNYAVSVRAWSYPGRISMARMPLTVITRRKSCSSVKCGNGVCQEKNAAPGYKCFCSSGYYGQHCEFIDPCESERNTPCRNGGTCVRNSARKGGFECRCMTGYMGAQCEVVNVCLTASNPCLNGGTCVSRQPGAFSCECVSGFSGQTCEINETNIYEKRPPSTDCQAEVTELPEGVFNWPQAPIGGSVSLPCPWGFAPRHEEERVQVEFTRFQELNNSAYEYNKTEENLHRRSTRSLERGEDEIDLEGFSRIPRSAEFDPGVSRSCEEGNSGSGVWTSPEVRFCLTGEDKIEDIVSLTSSSQVMNSSEVVSSVRRISNLVGAAITNKKVAQKMVSALSNIMDVGRTALEEERGSQTRASESIIAAINQYTANVPLKPGQKIKLRSKNLVLEAKLLHKDQLPSEVTFDPDALDLESESNRDDEKTSVSSTRRRRSIDHLHKDKKSWFKMSNASILDLIKEDDSRNKTENHVRFQFISFKDDRLFLGRNGTKKANNPVLSAIVGKKHVKRRVLGTPVSYMIPVREFDPTYMLPVCVFWDTEEHKWSTEGLRTKQNENGELFCQSEHLTSFSVLLDPIGSPVVSEVQPFLSIITYIGLALSSVALVATIITFALFRLHRDRSGLIVMNLSLALLVLNCSFFGAQFITSERAGCYFFGALLHYAVTVSFAWMLIEAVNMYQLLVTVFPSSETYFIRKRVILGWGCPLILVITALVWDKNVYFTEYQSICVISSYSAPAVYYTTYLGPVCAVLLVNVVVFFRVVRVLCQSRPSYNKESPVTLAQIRGAIAIVALLGITWLSGIIAVGHLRIVSQILFCLTTPFQGLIIFWVRVMQSADAKMAWKTFAVTGSTRKRPKPVSSLRTHSSSHHSSSLHTQSTGMTPPKSAFVSALVRRFSSGSSVTLGLIGSGKKKSRESTSSNSSTKKLKKNISNDIKKESLQTKNSVQPSLDNLYSRLTPQQKDNGANLTNGSFVGMKQEADDTIQEKDHSHTDISERIEVEEEPLKDLQDMLNEYPFFDKSSGISYDSNEYRESIFSFMSVQKEEKRILLQDEYTIRKGSVSTSNLSPEKTLAKSVKAELARSLESLLPNGITEISKDIKPPEDSRDRRDVSNSPNLHSSCKKVSKKISSCQNLSKTDSYDNDLTTRSISDSEINDTMNETNSSSLDLKFPKKVPVNVETYESQITGVIPINSAKVSFSHRATSEQNLGSRGDELTPFFRRSTSTAELDFMDQNMDKTVNINQK